MKMKKADVGVAIYIMAAIIMFIVPIRPGFWIYCWLSIFPLR